MITLVSVNVGSLQPLSLERPKTRSGIYKHAVAGPVEVTPLGLIGDRVGNSKHHGGPDQAVYFYASDDYAWWQAQGVAPTHPGTFGENLTLSAWWDDTRVGDRIIIGEAEFELTGPRIPCGTLASRMGDAQFVKRFKHAERCGAYARVLRRGTVEAGLPTSYERAPSDFPRIGDLFRLWYEPKKDPTVLRHALDTPIGSRLRAQFEAWL